MFIPLQPTEETRSVIDGINSEWLDEEVKRCVHAVIILGQDRAIIKRPDLNRLALQHNHIKSKAILQLANRELYKVFGMRLYETDDDKTKLLLINADSEYSRFIKQTDATCQELTILFFILMDIFVSSNEQISEQDIVNSLGPLSLSQEDLKMFLESYTKKLYLKLEKKQDERLYSWGQRAIAEVDPENFFRTFLALVGDDSDRNWPDLKDRVTKLKTIPHRALPS